MDSHNSKTLSGVEMSGGTKGITMPAGIVKRKDIFGCLNNSQLPMALPDAEES
jgi:hypothetical protein